MTIRRSDLGLSAQDLRRQSLREQRKRKLQRRLLLEQLERRELLTTGPQLVGIQPNEGELLTNNQVRQISPRELVFQFDDIAALDPATVGGIQITRSGFDGQFERASITTDLGTNGLVVLKFAAVPSGASGDGISLVLTKSNHGRPSLPTVTVTGKTISVDLNTNFLNESTASDLVTALGANAAAAALVTPSIELGDVRTKVAPTTASGTVLTLAGANNATVTSNFNAGANLQLRFTAVTPGLAGNGIKIQVTKVDRGGPAAPRVTVANQTINLELNSNLNNESTAQDVVNAVNGNAAAKSLVTARLDFGAPTTKLGNRTITFSPLMLTGANDVAITPGYINVAPNGREVIFRFAETLPDDRYRIEIDGTSSNALLDVNGQPFNGGRNQTIDFRLDLAPRIEAVVPQPITRVNGVLQQARNQIVVYFNHDHLQGDTLDPAKANDPKFYKLFLTKGTVRNNDDVLIPATVQYNATTETAVLTFANDLHQLAGASATGATFRLRVGTDEAVPAVPVTLTPAADPGSSFDTALNLAGTWNSSANPSQGIVISSDIANATTYDLDFPGANDEPGHRDIERIQNHLPGGADTHDGITTLFYNFQTEYGFDTRNNVLLNAITENQKQRAREIFELYSNFLGVQFIESANFGFTIVTGDLRAITPGIPTGVGAPFSLSDSATGRIILELQDFNQPGDDVYGGRWFQQAMKEIGRMLGFGPTDELPPLTIANDSAALAFNQPVEPIFPGDQDIVHGQYLFRPESNDIDLYKFALSQTGKFSVETFAERKASPSTLDTVISVYRQNANGSHELIARNDDYFSSDSYLELDLGPGTYFVGVSASGNNQYDPSIENSGLGGTSGDDPATTNFREGAYDLRLNFRPNANVTLADVTGVAFDGDANGVPGGVYDFWFRTQSAARTLIVDKAAAPGGVGTLAAPFSRIQTALANAQPNDIVRIVGNGGADSDLSTVADNRAYEIGFNRLGTQLADGPSFDVPKDVTVMIDSGAIVKLRRAMIGVGSTVTNTDRSGSVLQVLGTPRIVNAAGQVVRDANGQIVKGDVFLTSIHDSATGTDTNPDTTHPAALAGDWGGIWYRNDIDSAEKRFNWENEGIFLNVVNHATMRFGGGDVIVSGNSQTVSPVNMTDSRPTISYNTITGSADAALSANPDSFKETNFHTPEFQIRGAFTADYNRVGPDIQFNRLSGNTFNGIFVRLRTPAGTDLETLTVPGRFDDTDVVHVIAENLIIEGSPGGLISQAVTAPTQLITLSPLTGGTLPLGTYNYRITFVDASGNEGAASEPTRDLTLAGGQTSILLGQLPRIPAGSGFVARRIYRSQPDGQGPYTLVSQINATRSTLIDDGTSLGGTLVENANALDLRARLDARLVIDPGTVVKLDGARIETTMGAQLIAEGRQGREVIFTSLLDDRYGAGGTFDTSNQGNTDLPARGDWGGLFIGPLGKLSVDHAVIAYAGGVTKMDGSFAGVNAIELHQATARITNSHFERNGTGVGGQAPANRFGRGNNGAGSIFVRGAQPIIVNNTLEHNDSSAVNINVNSLNHTFVSDPGRSTGLSAAFNQFGDNRGPLIRLNRLDDNGGPDDAGVLAGVNGMQVRGGTLTTEGVWDDTDIVHVLLDQTVYVPDFHTYGGLSLNSGASESLVVKLLGSNAGFTAVGQPLDIDDRIGGALHLIGQPRFPVVLTAVADDSVGAGFRPNGLQQNDTNNDGDFRIATATGMVCPAPTSNVLTVTSSTNNGDALRDALLGSGITPIGAATYIGGATSAGFFENGSSIGIQCGIVLTTGEAVDAAGPNASDFTSNTSSLLPDPMLDAEFGVSTQDATSLEFQFVSDGGNLFFNFVFASEEYNEFVNSSFNDVFAFFLDGVNIALIPGTTTNVSINNVNGGGPVLGTNPTNPQFYNNNDPSDAGGFLAEFGYDGFTDVFTATALNLASGPHTIRLAVSDVFDSALDSAVFLQLGSFSDKPPADPPRPGQWNTVELAQYSHDRNVGIANETEPRDSAIPGLNGDPLTAQFLGQLAPNEKSGDDTRRLGFTVDGYLSQPGDLDVYSFKAAAGTEVWVDIDRTRNSLDSVVELISPTGQILALSNDSLAEEVAGAITFKAPGVVANPLRKQAAEFAPRNASGLVKDQWSTNPRDAGFRVVLPGTPGVVGPYQIRVRSSNLKSGDPVSKLTDLNQVSAGRTAGPYQLQIRLREQDEFAGSSIEYSDIRYANTGLTISGQPVHSPLTGEIAEDGTTNDLFIDAQFIGNLLASDRNVLSIAGDLSANQGTPSVSSDVDWYRFDLTYQALESIPGVTTAAQYFAAMFDIDYADGLARANTNLHVYDSAGNLILRATDSNVAEDRPGPLRGTDLTDLSRGTVGALDPLIGTVELPVGTYYVAVSNNSQVPAELQQYLVANPVNPLFRLEPINSLQRIVDEHIEPLDAASRPTGAPPRSPNLIDLSVNAVPFQLGDVTLFVSLDNTPPGIGTPAGNGTRIYTVDPFTGAQETFVGQFNQDVGDIALRHTGELFGFTTDLDDAARTDGGTGNYLNINTGTAAVTNLGDDGIVTSHGNPANPVQAIPSNDGIHFEAITYNVINGQPIGLAVGHRPPFVNSINRPSVDYFRNVLYQFDPVTGAAFSTAPLRTGNAVLVGPGTNVVPGGELRTDVGTTAGGSTAIVASNATDIDPLTGQTTRTLVDGLRFRIVDSLGVFHDFELDSGPEIRVTQNPTTGTVVRDGDLFNLDTVQYEIDTGTVLVVEALSGAGLVDGDTLTITNNQTPTGFRVFEFNNGVGGITPGNIEIRYNSGFSRTQIANAIITAINGANFGVSAVLLPNSNRITLIGESDRTGVPERPTGIRVEGSPGSFGASLLVPAEETFTANELAQAIANAVNARNVGGVVAGVVGDRVNFLNSLFGSFTDLVNRGVAINQNTTGGTSFPNAVPFLVNELGDDVAIRIATAINQARITGVSALANGKIVTLTGATLVGADPPLLPGGAGPGGLITGMAFHGTRLFAVSDTGGLFEVENYLTPDGATIRYIFESANDLLGINFQGLTAGPPNAEGGRYQDMLFAIDASGVIYAFDEFGQLQPVFADGATRAFTGLNSTVPNSQINGLAFSNLDYNLWHATTREPGRDATGNVVTAGHGVEAAFDGSRSGSAGVNQSLYFGFESLAANNVPNTPAGQSPANLAGTYNFPGGAYGSIETQPFSLVGYSPADQPVLYFNYFLDTEKAGSSANARMLDSARVFVGDDSGNWQLLATNNSTRGVGSEYDSTLFDVQELFDINANGAPTSWRQVRVPLDSVAGRDNLRLRFDFSTAGSMNIGGLRTTGDELRAIPGSKLRDGQQFVIDGTDIFEFDSGFTLVIPSGAAIQDGERLTVDGVEFEFDLGNGVNGPGIPVPYESTQTASQVALTLQQLLEANRPAVPNITGVDLGREDNDTLTTAALVGITGESVRLTATGSIGDNPLLLGTDRPLDVDLIRMDLDLNGRALIDIDAQQRNSPLNAALRIFDASGVELAYNDNFNGLDPFIDFVAPARGTYYVGISSSANRNYDPTLSGSGTVGTIGPYDLTITIGESFAAHRDGNRLNLEGADTITQSVNPALVVDGTPGTTVTNTVVVHGGMTDVEVATAIKYALANRYAQGRFEAIRGYNNVVRVINHDVTNPGPLGLTSQLTGDSFGEFTSTTRSLRGQNNAFEGFYIDDIIIGFAERGEMATGAIQNTTFAPNPLADPFDIQVGPYQLEVRRGTEYGEPLIMSGIRLTQTFDTNDRLTQQHSLIAPPAEQLTDGQTFVLSDGVNSVTFEYEDVTVNNGVAQGHVRIPFNTALLDPTTGAHTSESAAVIAARLRDAINSPQVQSLLNIRAALSDGTDRPTTVGNFQSSDVRINLFGNAIVTTSSTTRTADLIASESNDTLTTAVVSGIVGGNSDTFLAKGFIGDNTNIAQPSNDVDLIQVQLQAGERISIDIDAAHLGSLNSIVRVFDEFGFPLTQFFNDDGVAPGEVISTDSYVIFTAPATGAYFIGVSSIGNDAYDPFVEGNANQVGTTTGPYTIEIRRPDMIGSVGVQAHDGKGDPNQFRDQGQVLIRANRISDSAGFAIDVGPGLRDAAEGAPHAGPVRNTRELNTQKLVPGVTITNNLLVQNQAGGVSFRGDATDNLAPVPFGRIVNNTIVGGTIRLGANTSPQVIEQIIFPLGGASFADAVTTYVPLFVGGPAPDVANSDPTQALAAPDFTIDPITGVRTGAVSLGHGGRLVVEFTDNALIGSGDATPDLAIFEVDAEDEEVFVEISKDGTNYFAVGKASSKKRLIDIDAFGFGPNDLFRFVRLTDDVNQGSSTGLTVGADIDAVGAITTYVPPNFQPGGQGILVTDNASPTILNNIVVNNDVGIDLGAGANTTVIGGTVYQHNTTNSTAPFGLGDFPLNLNAIERLFVDPAGRNYYLADGSRAIDNSIDSLQDRPALTVVKTPLGIPVSPILAPDTDLTGQLRVDDPRVETPSGLGERVFKDRGALDRSDFVGPTGIITTPQDNDGAGRDKNPAVSIVELSSQTLKEFVIQLFDGINPTDPNDGIGADDKTVLRNTVKVFRGTNQDNLQPLVEGVDYRFTYDETNNAIHLTPLAGIWEPDRLYRVDLANRQRFVLSARTARGIPDGETFSIADRNGTTATFEFDRGYTLQFPTATPITDGTTFTIDDGTKIVSFEFDNNGIFNSANRQIAYVDTDPIDTISQTTINAIIAANVGLTPTNLGLGEIHLGGTAKHVVTTSSTELTLTGTPGVNQQPFGIQIPSQAGQPLGIADGQMFTISIGATTVRFELDSNGIFTPGNRQVRYFSNSGLDGIANALATAIGQAGLALTPVNLGNGLVALGGNANYVLNLTGSALLQVGTPGIAAAIPVSITDITADANSIAVLMANTINGAATITGVSAQAIGPQVFLKGAAAVSGNNVVSVATIKDLAGNPLKPNRVDGTTQFDIFLGSGLDFGDAPDGPYASKLANNGPRHQILDGFFLGNGVTVDVDGPGPDQADSDRMDDGIAFQSNFIRGYNATFTVTVAGGAGVVDAWIDFNKDGDFNDPFERVLTGVSLSPGTHTLNLQNLDPTATSVEAQGEVPGDATLGVTYARFRLSSSGVSSPTGLAPDGEVEDYQIQIFANPYQNPSNRLDVNADGFVSPIDALLVINYLNTLGSGPLSLPRPTPGPPFWDVNGDGQVSAIDANLVVIELNRLSNSGESLAAEAEGFDFDILPQVDASLAAFVAQVSPSIIGDSALDNSTDIARATQIARPLVVDQLADNRATGQSNRPSETLAPGRDASATRVRLQTTESTATTAANRQDIFANPKVADLEDLISEIAEDVGQSQSSGDSLDDFFANIHF